MKSRLQYLLLIFLSMTGSSLHAQLKGQARIDSLLKILPQQKEDSNKVILLNAIAKNMNDVSEFRKGLEYGQQTLALSEKLNWERGLALAYNVIGINYHDLSEFQKALDYYTHSLEHYQNLDDKKMIAALTANIGTMYQHLADYPKALKYYMRALKLNEEGGFSDNRESALYNIGGLYRQQKNYDKALEYLFEALKYDEEKNDTAAQTLCLCSIGAVYCDGLNDFPKALDYFFRSLQLAEETDSKIDMAYAIGNIGNVYSFQRNYQQAASYYSEALAITEEIGNTFLTANILNGLADIYLSLATDSSAWKTKEASSAKPLEAETPINNSAYKPATSITLPNSKSELIRRAINYSLRALKIAEEINVLFLKQNCYQILTVAYTQKGDYKKALDASDKYHAIKDSVFSQDNKEQILKMSMKNDYERQRFTDSLNTAEKQKIATIKLDRQKSYTYMGLAGIVLLAGFSFFIFRERGRSEAARKLSDELLLNVLPEEVATELKATGAAAARHFDEVTVLFTDFVNFTQASQNMEAQYLIDELHTCFKKFDEIADKYKIEKIKTIGDAYLAVAGLPTPDPKHAENVVQAAKEITAFMEDRLAKLGDEKTFRIRIGIHSGSVVAGIVGVKKFAYDIWGDTVNTAARMEQNCEAGKINISQTTYDLVKDKHACEYRGEVEAKGKGALKMYYVA